MPRPATLALAAALSGPALWHAFVGHDLSAQSALARFLIAVPVSAVMCAVLRAVTAGYRKHPKSTVKAVAERLDSPADPNKPPDS